MKKSKYKDGVEMWELMRDWLKQKKYKFKLDPVFPANQTFTIHKDESRIVQVWRAYPEVDVMVATGNANVPYKKLVSLDSRDPECFNKLEKLL